MMAVTTQGLCKSKKRPSKPHHTFLIDCSSVAKLCSLVKDAFSVNIADAFLGLASTNSSDSSSGFVDWCPLSIIFALLNSAMLKFGKGFTSCLSSNSRGLYLNSLSLVAMSLQLLGDCTEQMNCRSSEMSLQLAKYLSTGSNLNILASPTTSDKQMNLNQLWRSPSLQIHIALSRTTSRQCRRIEHSDSKEQQIFRKLRMVPYTSSQLWTQKLLTLRQSVMKRNTGRYFSRPNQSWPQLSFSPAKALYTHEICRLMAKESCTRRWQPEISSEVVGNCPSMTLSPFSRISTIVRLSDSLASLRWSVFSWIHLTSSFTKFNRLIPISWKRVLKDGIHALTSTPAIHTLEMVHMQSFLKGMMNLSRLVLKPYCMYLMSSWKTRPLLAVEHRFLQSLILMKLEMLKLSRSLSSSASALEWTSRQFISTQRMMLLYWNQYREEWCSRWVLSYWRGTLQRLRQWGVFRNTSQMEKISFDRDVAFSFFWRSSFWFVLISIVLLRTQQWISGSASSSHRSRKFLTLARKRKSKTWLF